MRIIIGITGTLGAGKGSVVSYLRYWKQFVHYSVSGFISEEIARRGLTGNRDTMRSVANDLRAQYGVTYMVDSLYARALVSRQDVIIESLRALGEVRRIKELGGFVIGVDANQRIRYERALARKSVKDNITYEKFVAQELSEINEGDPCKQNLRGALQEADTVIYNDGTIEDFRLQIKNILFRMSARA